MTTMQLNNTIASLNAELSEKIALFKKEEKNWGITEYGRKLYREISALKEKISEFEYMTLDDEDENTFVACDECDLPDACADFGCAIKSGIKTVL